jgi:tetratricopeptide (TPR) repeat protein
VLAWTALAAACGRDGALDLERGRNALARHHYRWAVNYLSRAAHASPQARGLLGEALMSGPERDPARALRELDRAIAAGWSAVGRERLLRARAALELGLAGRALADMAAPPPALEVEAHALRGRAFELLGRRRAAEAAYRRAWERAPRRRPEAGLALAGLLADRGQHQAALAILERLRAEQPLLSAALYQSGRMLLALGRPASAQRRLALHRYLETALRPAQQGSATATTIST